MCLARAKKVDAGFVCLQARPAVQVPKRSYRCYPGRHRDKSKLYDSGHTKLREMRDVSQEMST